MRVIATGRIRNGKKIVRVHPDFAPITPTDFDIISIVEAANEHVSKKRQKVHRSTGKSKFANASARA